jgi:hypothetical protein
MIAEQLRPFGEAPRCDYAMNILISRPTAYLCCLSELPPVLGVARFCPRNSAPWFAVGRLLRPANREGANA